MFLNLGPGSHEIIHRVLELCPSCVPMTSEPSLVLRQSGRWLQCFLPLPVSGL